MDPATPRPADIEVRQLAAAFYAELRQLARRQRGRNRGSETLRTTALVHEAYLKLMTSGLFQSRQHFLNTAAVAMRQVLVDHARARLSAKRGGGLEPLPLGDADGVLAETDERVLALHEALERLEADQPRLVRVVEMRYFAGLSEVESAGALGVTERTVQRDWAKAKAILYEALRADGIDVSRSEDPPR